MRVLLTTNPGIGHLLPMVPVARALAAAGHTVAVASARSFAPTIESYGLPALPTGLDWLQAEAAATFPELRGCSPVEQSERFIGDIFADSAAHAMARELRARCAEWAPDLLVRNDFEFGSCVAAEVMGLPLATVSISFYLPEAFLTPMIADQLAYLRSANGLDPYPPLAMLASDLYLSFTAPSFQPCLRPGMHALRPLGAEPDGAALPDWFHKLPERPVVYVSMSSAYRLPELLPTIIAGLCDEPITLIVTVGRGQDPAQLGPQPDNVHVVPFIPQHALFPHCDLFVTHNPFATMMGALCHGLPLLMIPLAGELPMGAARAAELGLGLMLRHPDLTGPYVPRAAPLLSPESVRAAARQILHNPAYRLNARRMGAELRSLPGPEHLVSLLEAHATAAYSARL